MDAYVYKAALLCEGCAAKVMKRDNAVVHAVEREDSDYWPQGPYSDGGGEADTPQHCYGCHCYLDNPLTRDGVEYVLEALETEASNPDEANRIMPKLGTAEASEGFSIWHGQPHKAIVLSWAESLHWYGLSDEQEERLLAALDKLA